MRYLDLDLEIGPGTGRSYPLGVRSEAGDTHVTMQFPYDELALKDTLKDLRIALLQSSQTHRALTDEEQAVQEFGQRLFEALFAGVAGSLFYESRNKAAQEGLLGVRVRLHIQAPELAGLPWEYLYDPRAGEYLCLSRATPVVRYPELAAPLQPLLVTPPLRILGMIASPSDQDPLDLTREQTRLEEALKSLTSSGLVELVWLSGQTWEDVQAAMWQGPWHIFHYIGHGGYDKRADEGVLALCDEEGQTRLLFARDLARLLTNHRALRLVVLNACEGAKSGASDLFSSTAASLARRGIPAVLAMQEQITDQAAIQLTRTFYRALAVGLPVEAAVAEARLAISVSLRHSLEWGTPVLFLRAPDSTLFQLGTRSTPAPALPADAPPARAPDETAQREPSSPSTAAKGASAKSESTPAAVRAAPSAPVKAAPTAPVTGARQPAPPAQTPVEAGQAPPPPPPTKTTAHWVKEGDQHHTAGRWMEALSCYEQALKLDQSNVRALRGKSLALFNVQRPEEALRVAEEAIRRYPSDAAAQYTKGFILSGLQRYQEAVPLFEEALTRNPHYGRAALGKGQALAALGRMAEALAVLEYALALTPNDPAVRQALEDLARRLPGGTLLLTLPGPTSVVGAVAWSPDGRRLASAHWDRTVRLWDSASGQLLATLSGHTGGVLAVAWSPDGRWIASAGGVDQTVRLWDAESGQLLAILSGHTNYVRAVAWSPDSRLLASASGGLVEKGHKRDDTVRLWDTESGQLLAILSGHTNIVNGVAWSPNGRRLASASADQTVRLWDADGKPLSALKGHNTSVQTVAWSPDGRRLASGSGSQLRSTVASLADRTVRLWDSASGQLLATLSGHTGGVQAVAWSPDGRRLASASWDQTVCLWDLQSLQPLATLKGHTDVVRAVAWSPDGRRLASAGGSSQVETWSMDRFHLNPTTRLAPVPWSVDRPSSTPARGSQSEGKDYTVRVWWMGTG